ncbi:M81 family metallopeptidase [bacterium]|nr:M81 family metallopeptidase [bacterium]
MKRVIIGAVLHETNMFNPQLTGIREFGIQGLFTGNDVLTKRRGTATELGGFIDVLGKNGAEIIPTVCAFAMPAGPVTDEAAGTFLESILDTLDRHQADGVLLALHGAMVTETCDDGEGYILEKIRAKVGNDIPVVHTLDLHATLTPRMAVNANAVTIYRTYPHIDMFDRGCEAASIMLDILDGRMHPVIAISKPPVMIGPPQNVLPTDYPMKLIMDRAREMERTIPGIIAACPAQGFMQQDVPHAGIGVAVTADNDRELAQKCADELGEMMFAHRREYLVDLPDAAETIRIARASELYPVAIADSGDNIGGGGPGDGTALLREIIRQGVDSAFVQLYDPESAQKAAHAGVGAMVTLDAGGKSDSLYGPPVTITGKVRTITDGRYLNRAWGGYWAGVESNMGLSARIDSGGITVVVTSHSITPDNSMHAKAIGVYPEDYRMIVCKGGLAFREAYKPPLIRRYIQSDTPGYTSSNLKNFTYTKIKRPMFPIDDM